MVARVTYKKEHLHGALIRCTLYLQYPYVENVAN